MREPEIVHGTNWELIPAVLPDWPKIDCLLTDPPYGVAAQSTYGKNPKDIAKYQQKIANDESPEKAIADFDQMLCTLSGFLAETCEIYIFSDIEVDPQWQPYLKSLEAAHGIRYMTTLVWDKGYPGLGDFTYCWGKGYEIIYYLKKGLRLVPYRRSGIIAVDKVRPGTGIHPMEKPTKLLKKLIDYSTIEGQFVFDPYCGSGSTVLAATEMGREALGMEENKLYIPEARSRLPLPGLFSL